MAKKITYPIQSDFDFATPLLDALKFCVGFKVVSFVENGPGGGWPNLVVEFENDQRVVEFVKKYCEGYEESFADTLELTLEPHLK